MRSGFSQNPLFTKYEVGFLSGFQKVVFVVNPTVGTKYDILINNYPFPIDSSGLLLNSNNPVKIKMSNIVFNNMRFS